MAWVENKFGRGRKKLRVKVDRVCFYFGSRRFSQRYMSDVSLRCSYGIDWYIRTDFGLIVHSGKAWSICHPHIDAANDRIRVIEWVFDKFD